jgi:hypothetical protein
MSVVFPVEDHGPMFDCYLDDLFGVSRGKGRLKLEAVLPFILHLIGRPVEEEVPESLPREALIAVSKVPGGGQGVRDEDDSRVGSRYSSHDGVAPARPGGRATARSSSRRSDDSVMRPTSSQTRDTSWDDSIGPARGRR